MKPTSNGALWAIIATGSVPRNQQEFRQHRVDVRLARDRRRSVIP
jgi:hypothetical protein